MTEVRPTRYPSCHVYVHAVHGKRTCNQHRNCGGGRADEVVEGFPRGSGARYAPQHRAPLEGCNHGRQECSIGKRGRSLRCDYVSMISIHASIRNAEWAQKRLVPDQIDVAGGSRGQVSWLPTGTSLYPTETTTLGATQAATRARVLPMEATRRGTGRIVSCYTSCSHESIRSFPSHNDEGERDFAMATGQERRIDS